MIVKLEVGGGFIPAHSAVYNLDTNSLDQATKQKINALLQIAAGHISIKSNARDAINYKVEIDTNPKPVVRFSDADSTEDLVQLRELIILHGHKEP